MSIVKVIIEIAAEDQAAASAADAFAGQDGAAADCFLRVGDLLGGHLRLGDDQFSIRALADEGKEHRFALRLFEGGCQFCICHGASPIEQ